MRLTMSDSTKLTVNYFCVGALFIFAGSVLLCALGFTIVLPFEATRSWPQVLCSVINSSYDSSVCSCDEQLSVFDTCVSKYPCLQIYVSYSAIVESNESDHLNRGQSAWSDRPQSLADVANPRRVSPGRSMQQRNNDDDGKTRPANMRFRREEHQQQHQHKLNDLLLTTGESKLLLTTTSLVVGQNASLFPAVNSRPDISTISADEDELPVTTNYEVSAEGLMMSAVSLLSSSFSPPLVRRTSIPVGGGDENNNSPDDVMGLMANRMSATVTVRPSHDVDTRSSTGAQLGPETEANSSVGGMLSYSVNERSTVGVTATASEEDLRLAKLYRSWDDSFHHECSLTECGDDVWNVREARRFRSEWGRVGQSFICFYNPSRPEMTIIERTSPVSAVHAVIWPCLFLVTGIALWLGLCFGCWSVKAGQSYKEDYSGIAIR